MKNIFDDVTEFDWNEANIEHIARHNVQPQEAEEVFFDEEHVLTEDVKHSVGEKRFVIIGKTKKERMLYQVFTKRKKKIRIISSRDINKKEVRLYEKEASSTKVQKRERGS